MICKDFINTSPKLCQVQFRLIINLKKCNFFLNRENIKVLSTRRLNSTNDTNRSNEQKVETKKTGKCAEKQVGKLSFLYRKFHFVRKWKRQNSEEEGKHNILTNSCSLKNHSTIQKGDCSNGCSGHIPEWKGVSSIRYGKGEQRRDKIDNKKDGSGNAEINDCKKIETISIKQTEMEQDDVNTVKNCKDVIKEDGVGERYASKIIEQSNMKQEIEKCNETNEFLTILYTILNKKATVDNCIKEALIEKMRFFIKNCDDIKTLFLLLYTLNKLVCINKLIKILHERIYRVDDSEMVSIILRILVNCNYYNESLFSHLLNKLKEHVYLHICSTLAISNTFYSYAVLYKRNILQFSQIPLQNIIQIIVDHYTSFSDVQIFEIISSLQYFKFRKEKTEKDLYKSVSHLFKVCGNYLISNEKVRLLSFKELKEIVYSYAKNKMCHEKLFLFCYPFFLSHIKKHNKNMMRYKWRNAFNNSKNSSYDEVNVSSELNESQKVVTKNNKNNWTTTDIIDKEEIITNSDINDAIQNVCDVLYAFSKFYMYIDELYNEILIFLHNFYKYIDCSNLSQCLISLTKVNSNIRILLSKVHYYRFPTNSLTEANSTGKWDYFKYAHSTDIINFLLAFSRNLYLEKDVYDTLSKLIQKKIFLLESPDLINIIHAYSKVYYIDEPLFSKVDKILCSKLESDPTHLSVELAMKYLNACAKLSYKNEKLLYKIVEIIHETNFVNMKIYDLFKILKSTKQLGISFDNLEEYIKTIAPNYNLDFSKKNNFYYKTEKEMHMRRKKWIW